MSSFENFPPEILEKIVSSREERDSLHRVSRSLRNKTNIKQFSYGQFLSSLFAYYLLNKPIYGEVLNKYFNTVFYDVETDRYDYENEDIIQDFIRETKLPRNKLIVDISLTHENYLFYGANENDFLSIRNVIIDKKYNIDFGDEGITLIFLFDWLHFETKNSISKTKFKVEFTPDTLIIHIDHQ